MAKFYAKAPDGSDALLSIVLTGFTQSLQQNGWCKLPNGLLFQWGLIANTIEGSLFITLNLVYSTYYLPFTTDWSSNDIPYSVVNAVDYTTMLLNGFTVIFENKIPRGLAWFAIGN